MADLSSLPRPIAACRSASPSFDNLQRRAADDTSSRSPRWRSLRRARPPARSEARTARRLLTYGPADDRPATGAPSFVVVPRPGRSPWSSKATDIAATAGWRPCAASSAASTGTRDGRGGRPVARPLDARVARPRPDDERSSTVRRRARAVRHVEPRPLASVPLLARTAALVRATRLGLADDEIDYLDALFRAAAGIRRTSLDVRAGELRALPPQDLQRKLDRRRRSAAEEPVRDDPRYARGASAGHGHRLLGQRGGDGGGTDRSLPP
jgi:hypothetical protein